MKPMSENPPILRQRRWTTKELLSLGFQYYNRIPAVVMARPHFGKFEIDSQLEKLTGEGEYMICYDARHASVHHVEQVPSWPVRADIFDKTYARWNVDGWQPNSLEAQLSLQGCQPYTKVSGVWAARLREAVLVQSLESATPVAIPSGAWLVIGTDGEPYGMEHNEFKGRYTR